MLPNRVLGIFAHPDDGEILAGGTLARAAEGHLLILGGNMFPHEQHRVVEQESACALLGVQLHWGTFSHNEIPWGEASVACIERAVRSINPDLIITHHPEEQHQDHFNVSRSVMGACRHHHHRIWVGEPYAPSGGQRHHFFPQVYVDITDQIDAKRQAMECHRSQIDSLSYSLMDGLIGRSMGRGGEVGVRYAECFQVVRYLI